jgi:transposase
MGRSGGGLTSKIHALVDADGRPVALRLTGGQVHDNIPSRSTRKQCLAFSPWLYRQRNLVERFFNRIKHFRGIATRYDKCPENYLAAVKLMCAHLVRSMWR